MHLQFKLRFTSELALGATKGFDVVVPVLVQLHVLGSLESHAADVTFERARCGVCKGVMVGDVFPPLCPEVTQTTFVPLFSFVLCLVVVDFRGKSISVVAVPTFEGLCIGVSSYVFS